MKKLQKDKKVLVFGTFDRLHPGHIFFFNEAKKFGDLIVSVASNHVVKNIKKDKFKTEKQRVLDIKKLKIAKKVIVGDNKIHSWKKLEKINPDIVAVGYDQKKFKKALEKYKKENNKNFEIKVIKSFMPRKYHSSIIKAKNKIYNF